MTRPTCYHQQKTVVWSSVGADGEPLAGPRQLRHQCADCGRLLPSALPHGLSSAETPNVDLEALRAWIGNDREQWSQRRQEGRQLEQQRQDEWRQRYEQYLLSDQWMLKRDKVFERSKGRCEGCGEAKATAVHHLTYDHLGNELLWELAAVCRDCHERAHNIGNPSQSSHQHQVGSGRPLLHDMPRVFPQAEKAPSKAEMPGRNDQQRRGDVGMQSLRMDRR